LQFRDPKLGLGQDEIQSSCAHNIAYPYFHGATIQEHTRNYSPLRCAD
jgi:hypothetical protein